MVFRRFSKISTLQPVVLKMGFPISTYVLMVLSGVVVLLSLIYRASLTSLIFYLSVGSIKAIEQSKFRFHSNINQLYNKLARSIIFYKISLLFIMGIRKGYIRDGRAPVPAKAVTSKVMSANKAKDTKPELLLRKAIYEHGLKGYRLNWKNAPGRPDIAFPGKQIAIFVHGCFWHRCPTCNLSLPKSNQLFWSQKFSRNLDRDQIKQQQLTAMGWRVITVWECEIRKNITNIVNDIKNHILEPQTDILSIHG